MPLNYYYLRTFLSKYLQLIVSNLIIKFAISSYNFFFLNKPYNIVQHIRKYSEQKYAAEKKNALRWMNVTHWYYFIFSQTDELVRVRSTCCNLTSPDLIWVLAQYFTDSGHVHCVFTQTQHPFPDNLCLLAQKPASFRMHSVQTSTTTKQNCREQKKKH